jgi:hypothetical protein
MNAFPKIKEFPFSMKFFGVQNDENSPFKNLKIKKKKPGLDNCNIKKHSDWRKVS